MIRRTLAALLTTVIALAASAATRTMDNGTRPAAGATLSGVVTSVSGNLIHLANGNVTIDAKNAKIHGGTIEPGMIVFAALSSTDVAPNAPLPATTITATRIPDATFFGPVQSVDLTNNTITLLGRTIRVTPDTSFGGIRKSFDGERPSLKDVLPNHIVQVVVDERNGQLFATSLLLLAPTLPEVHATRGTVKSIGADAWVIDRERGDDLTVQIDAQTKIAGSPKVGDTVEVLYRVDSANANIAISIIKFQGPTAPPAQTLRLTGTVVSIAADNWVITKAEGNDRITVKIAQHSRIEPGIRVSDKVEVLAQRHDDGSHTALLIVKKR